MATLSDFYPYVMPSVQGCPTPLVINAVRCAVNDFCERTMMWRYKFEAADLIAGQRDYSFVTPVGSSIAKPVYVAVNGFQLQPTNTDDLDALTMGWRDAESSQPAMYYMDYNSTLVILPTPTISAVGGLDLEVALKIDITADYVPDWMFQNWAEIIAHGALMRLHAMPGKAWADTQTVQYHRSKFREGITHARSRTMKSFAKQGKAVQPRLFWQ